MALVSSPDWVLVQLSMCSWTACQSSVKPHPLPCHWSMMKNTGSLGSRHATHTCLQRKLICKQTDLHREIFLPQGHFCFYKRKTLLTTLVELIGGPHCVLKTKTQASTAIHQGLGKNTKIGTAKYWIAQHMLVLWHIIFNMHLQVLETYLKQFKKHVEQVWGNVHSLDGFLRSLCYIKK